MYTIHLYTSNTTFISAVYELPGYANAEAWAIDRLLTIPAYMLAEIWQEGVFLKAFEKP